jgi:hypothetical protein
MVNPTALIADFNQSVSEFGSQIRARYFNVSGADASFDDDVVLTQSGIDIWTSGVIQPISNEEGSNDAQLMEQGNLINNDLRLYVQGSFQTSGTFRIGLGSPITAEYGLSFEKGVTNWEVGGTSIYKRIYLRQLTTGSLNGE